MISSSCDDISVKQWVRDIFLLIFCMSKLDEDGNVSTKMEKMLRSSVKVFSTLFRNVYQYRTWVMCQTAVEKEPYVLCCVSYEWKTQERCEKTSQKWPFDLHSVPYEYMTQDTCKRAFEKKKTIYYLWVYNQRDVWKSFLKNEYILEFF